MNLSNDLISQFVKITKDSNTKDKKTTAYGSVIEYNGDMYVQLDGSDLLTPVDTTTELHVDDRVIVDITKHNATATGNISNPSISGVELTRTEDSLRIEFEEGLENLLLVFKEGYYEGITTVNAEGVTVSHTAYEGYTKMSYSGFYINDGKSDVLSCTKDGLVYTGTITASDIASLDGTFQIDKNGNITGATFKSSKGGNFSIDENGEITAAGLTIEDNISSDTIICNAIMNQAYPKTLTGAVDLYVDPDTGNDNQECVSGAVYKTLQGCINKIPKFLNGKTVKIYLRKNYSGNADFSHFCGGRIYLCLNGRTLYGTVHFYNTTAYMAIYGGTTDNTTKGTIHPYTGLNSDARSTSIVSNASRYVYLAYLNVYGPDNAPSGCGSTKQAVGCHGGGFAYVVSVDICNCNIGFRCHGGCQLHMNTSTGVADIYGFEATTGGQISLSGNPQSGGRVSATNNDHGGQIWKDDATKYATGDTTNSGSTAPAPSTSGSVTYTSSSAQALQYVGTSSVKWRTDMTPKVGNWGYGNHTAWWFFGDSFENVKDKNVTKIEITFTRNRGGNAAATTHYFYAHDYESQPSTTSPSFYGTRIGSASTPTYASSIITITSPSLISAIISRKGICSVPPAQSSTYYSVMSATMRITFTYSS